MTSFIMPNKNYIKGRNKEYKLVQSLKHQGCEIAQRTAGSHSPIDLFGINKKTRTITFIQSKPSSYTSSQIDKIKKELYYLTGQYTVIFRVL